MQWRNEPSTCIGQAQHLQFNKRKCLFSFLQSCSRLPACSADCLWPAYVHLLVCSGIGRQIKVLNEDEKGPEAGLEESEKNT